MADIICVSGGFDPLHSGHLNYIKDAACYGRVVVILNSDEWLVRKKGYCLLPWNDRAYILSELRDVSLVVHVEDSDDSVCKALQAIRPRFFANGGDRKEETKNSKESALCEKLSIMQIFNIGGRKTQSSSDVVRAACRQMN